MDALNDNSRRAPPSPCGDAAHGGQEEELIDISN
jgi:hypothetical protein